jgi:D-3-phosphoglycerate dehydrogenase
VGTRTVAVIGDRFVRTAQFRAAIERAAGGSGAELRFVTDEHEWPDAPVRHDAEIREYTGDYRRVSRVLREAEVAAVHMAALSAEVLAAAPRLRLVACARSGAVNVNLTAATGRGIQVCNAPGRNARAVAEFTVALIIDITKGISRGHRDLAGAARWRADLYRYDAVGDDLASLTVGLLGLGYIGRLLAPLLGAFGARVLACDPYLEAAAFAAAGVERCDLQRLLALADVVSLHARHSGERPLVGAAELAQMRPGCYLIQTARGPLLDYDALARALAGGHLAGAAIDVFAEEPLPAGHPLLELPNVTLTPHIAGASRGSARAGIRMAAASVAAYLRGESPPHCLNYPSRATT